jgi:hypothetical protein
MKRRHRGEDDRHLGYWVDAVVRRWAARALSPAQRLVLFRHLLARLTLAEPRRGAPRTSPRRSEELRQRHCEIARPTSTRAGSRT